VRLNNGRRGAELVEAVRDALGDLANVCRLLGLTPRNERGGLFRCAFHQDKTPSFSLFASERGGWAGRCHACGVAGDGLALVARHLGHSTRGGGFLLAIEHIAAELGITESGRSSSSRRSAPRPAPARAVDEAQLRERREMQSRIHDILLVVAPLGDEGYSYIRSRGFHDDEVPRDWCLLPRARDQHLVVQAIVDEVGADAWLESGLSAKSSSGFNFPGNRLVLPWPASTGVDATIALLQRRLLGDGQPKYVLPSGLAAVLPYGAPDLAEMGGEDTRVLIVEGVLDAVAARALAREDDVDLVALGIPGARSWRPEWGALVTDRDVSLGLDPDLAGKGAALVLANTLRAAGARSINITTPPGGEDWSAALLTRRSGRRAA